jgi:leucyl/phenylalanyl-tRNA--protein transferase
MPIFWLSQDSIDFPPSELANPDGLLAIGGDLQPKRLLHAYARGIFPWYNDEEPILWWSPDPRFVLFPKELRISRSIRPYFNQKKFRVTFDQDFKEVIISCKQPREGQSGGTWISKEMVDAYCCLYELGFAHSVEVWQGKSLAGGLYGLSLGKCFFGESMFSRVSNASRFGFISLVKALAEAGYWLIDCQQQSSYLSTFGARSIPRKDFNEIMERNLNEIGNDNSGRNFSDAIRNFYSQE